MEFMRVCRLLQTKKESDTLQGVALYLLRMYDYNCTSSGVDAV